jgi:hypothetical protein
MNKLQSLVAEIEALPAEQQQELVSMFAYLNTPKDDIFELTDAELAELDRRMLNLDNEPTYSSEEVFESLRKRYVQSDLA